MRRPVLTLFDDEVDEAQIALRQVAPLCLERRPLLSGPEVIGIVAGDERAAPASAAGLDGDEPQPFAAELLPDVAERRPRLERGQIADLAAAADGVPARGGDEGEDQDQTSHEGI